jgi:Divergent InlB B-repeat domain
LEERASDPIRVQLLQFGKPQGDCVVNLAERALAPRRSMGPCLIGLLATVLPAAAIADAPIASSNFAGSENPLWENGAWEPIVSMSPDGMRFQKNNAAFPNQPNGPNNNHAGARTTVALPVDHYSEIVVGHVEDRFSYVGPMVRAQTSGAALDSNYLWWGSLAGGDNNFLYRIDANGTSYRAASIVSHSPIADGDRLRLIARGPVIYGIKNGVREFIHNTGQDALRYDGGTAGMLAFVQGSSLTNSTIASWSAGAAPVSSGVWASTNFSGAENPLDEGDRWYPLPSYSGFSKAGGFAMGLDGGHNASGAWGIAPPQKQYSQVTLGTVASGGGGPMVRIDRNNTGQTGYLLFLWADNPTQSGLFELTPNGNFVRLQTFAATLVTGDKWRLTADGNLLSVYQNGILQFTFTTDGSYPSGDVGIEALTPAFTFMGWEGGDANGPGPTIASFSPTAGPVGTSVTINGTGFTGATAVAFNGVAATFSVSSDTTMQATVPAGATTGPLSVTTPAGTSTSSSAFTVIRPPTITSFTPAAGPVGTSVTINGADFSGATSVTFNGATASFAVTSDTAIQATVPAGATTGPVSVTTPGGMATSSGSFAVVSPPTISSLTPTSGRVGANVTISGTAFTGATGVAFNGVSASFTVASDTMIKATVPAGATTGPVSVTTPGGTATSSDVFTVKLLLSVSNAGNGSGNVTSTSDPASASQIDCGTNCSVTYSHGTVVTLTATPATGSTFTSWSGCDSASGNTCTVTMRSSNSVTATFTLQRFTLAVSQTNTLGLGNGTVTSTSNPSSPTQIDCGSSCSASYDYGTVVTLTATPDLLSVFNGWSGNCDSTSGATCTVTITGPKSVMAKFLP